uniref:Uncharacterized protein n=1 Tax=Timema poppense TaxID=170557 RepID=A0A7R9DGI4_TIMPO|nr:unnamed protein product [Timema poppensis]
MVVSCWGQEFQSTSVNTQPPQMPQGTRPLNAATATVEQSRSRLSHATQASRPTPSQLNFQKSVRDAVERRVKQQQKEAILPDNQEQIRRLLVFFDVR